MAMSGELVAKQNSAATLALHQLCASRVHACRAVARAKAHLVLVIWAVVALMPKAHTLPVPAALKLGARNPRKEYHRARCVCAEPGQC